MASQKKNTTTRKPGNKNVKPIIVQTLDIRQITRENQDVGKWRNAMKAAESVTNPNRTRLYDLYHDLLLDAQLGNACDTRRLKITNANLQFTGDDGKVIDSVQDIIESPMFYDMLGDIIETRFWGFSLLEFNMTNGALQYELINRKHVKPELGFVAKNQNDTNGISFTEPPFNKYLLPIGKKKDLGLLLGVAPYVLYKRGGFGDWAQLAEIFGIPPRWAFYDGFDENTRTKLNQGLASMGSANYGVFPDGTRIEIGDTPASQNGDMFKELKNACDEQIAIRLLGQTMTTKDGSSLSQAKVHADVAAEVFKDDKTYTLNILNHDFKRVLKTFGIETKGWFKFVDDTKINLKDRVYIDTQLAQHIILTPEYWHETYGIDMPDNYEQLLKEAEEKNLLKTPEFITKNLDRKTQPTELNTIDPNTTRRTPMRALYNPPETRQPVFDRFNPFAMAGAKINKADFKALDKEAKRLATLIYNGELPDDYYVSETMVELIATHLRQAVESGYGNLASFAAGSTDAATIKQLNDNIYKFSAAKNYNMLRDINAALLDSDGKRRSLNDFNRAVENLNIEYNRNWQATEYNTAQASSQMASKWNQYQDEAEAVPMLTFVTAGDEHVRDSHRKLDGMTAPANDPVWKKIWPPLDWGCRCDVIQHENDNAKRKVPGDDELPVIGKGFENNAGATGEIFDTKHPYFKGVPEEVANKIFK